MSSGFESEFPGNSRREREETPPEVVKKVEQVTEGTVIRRKPSLFKRTTSLFIAGDSSTVVDHIVRQVLLPGAKDLVADLFTEYFERMLYGEKRSSNRRSGSVLRSNGSSTPGYVSYNRFAPTAKATEPSRASTVAKMRSSTDLDDIILATRIEAENVIDGLFDQIQKYHQATVADLYDLIGVDDNRNFMNNKWGWKDIRGADFQHLRSGGYLLRLPQPIDL